MGGVDIVLLPFDLSHPDTPARLYAETAARGLRIDALVNDAGFGETGYFIDTDLATELAAAESTIVAELAAVQGDAVDLGGYYYVDKVRTDAVMRPSATMNGLIDAF